MLVDIYYIISGIAFTLFANSVGIVVRRSRSSGKLNLPLAIPSALIFIFATLVGWNLLGS